MAVRVIESVSFAGELERVEAALHHTVGVDPTPSIWLQETAIFKNFDAFPTYPPVGGLLQCLPGLEFNVLFFIGEENYIALTLAADIVACRAVNPVISLPVSA